MHVTGSLFFDSKYTSPKAIPRASSDQLESTTTDILHPSQGLAAPGPIKLTAPQSSAHASSSLVFRVAFVTQSLKSVDAATWGRRSSYTAGGSFQGLSLVFNVGLARLTNVVLREGPCRNAIVGQTLFYRGRQVNHVLL